jgi:glycosyltransferase involved in cell wall biosynthesis
MNTVIVVPCYNEALRLNTAAFLAYARTVSGVSFLLVDDGSRDATWSVLERLRDEGGPAFHILRKQPNGGKAEAVRDGMNYALEHLKPELVGFWDADLATPLEAIGDLACILVRQPSIEMVFGARVQLLGRHVDRHPIRHYLGRIFATVVSIVLRLPIYDTQCGAKIFRVTPQLAQALADPFVSKWVFDVELIARFIRLNHGDSSAVGARIYEFPLHVWRDVAGSKLRSSDFLKAFRDVVRIYRRYLR